MTEIFRQLNTEWASLADEDVTSWATSDTLAGCRTACEVLDAVRPGNDVLRLLVIEAQAGNHLAGRIALQAMLGKLIRLSGSGRARSIPTAGDDLVTAFWEQIMTLPVARRSNIAASLALDTLHAAQSFWADDGEQPPAAIQVVHLVEFDAPAPITEEEAAAAEVLDLASDLRWLDPASMDLMRTLYIEGQDVAQAASTLEVSACTVYRRRNTALDQLREHADELALLI